MSKVLNKIWEYVVITFGTFVFCFAWEGLLVPNHIAGGGLTGLCTVIQFATFGTIKIANSYLILNSLLLLIGFIVLGNAFGFKTIYVLIVSYIFFKIIPQYDFLKSIPGQPLYIEQKILVPIIAGLVEGFGISLIFHRGGSTGGTDVIALIVDKFWPISPGKVYLFTDMFIIASVYLTPVGNLQTMIYGYLVMITFSWTIDALLMGRKSTVQVLVFSEKNEEIGNYILHNFQRGVTALKSVGWYTKQEKNVLLVIVRKTQLQGLTKAIENIDPKAFISISQASTVYGEGFEEIKTGMNKNQKIFSKEILRDRLNSLMFWKSNNNDSCN